MKVKGFMKNAIPSQENIDKINKLYDEGWEIVGQQEDFQKEIYITLQKNN